MKKNKLSVAIITLNEKENIAHCIKSVSDIADEIIVVDSQSQDDTVKIAKSLGARVYIHPFKSFYRQKNYAASLCKGNWIFSLDADERATPQLKKEILSKIRSNKFNAYSIPRKNYILGKFIKHSRWQPHLDSHVWLWKKNFGEWKGSVHEEVKVQGPIGKIKEAKLHYSKKTPEEFFLMLNTYSELESETISKKKAAIIFNLVAQPAYNFFVRYVYRLGFMDGWRGFVLCYMMGIYHFILWAKVWEKTKSS
jgi:glycosyltransferase involved in cell wall biosynthesis